MIQNYGMITMFDTRRKKYSKSYWDTVSTAHRLFVFDNIASKLNYMILIFNKFPYIH